MLIPAASGTNLSDCCNSLSDAINSAGAADILPTALNFDAKQGIKDNFEPKVQETLARAQTTLSMPSLAFTPNFEANYAKLAAYQASFDEDDDERCDLVRDWQKRLGEVTLRYFEAFTTYVKRQKYHKDDMLREAFADAVGRNEVQLRVVDELHKRRYNEIVLEDGMLAMQTVPKYWFNNVDDIANDLNDLL